MVKGKWKDSFVFNELIAYTVDWLVCERTKNKAAWRTFPGSRTHNTETIPLTESQFDYFIQGEFILQQFIIVENNSNLSQLMELNN